MQLRPKVEDLISRFREIKLIFIDAEKMPEICGHFGIFSSPTILLFFDGKENQRFSKYVSVDQLHEAIARPYRMMFGD